MSLGHFMASVPLFQRAISFDPKFTMAYYALGIAYEQTGDMERSAEYAKQAFDGPDRVSGTEPPEIVGYYHRATGELNKEIDAYESAVGTNYPRRWNFHYQISLTYLDMGKFEDALKEGLEAVRCSLESNQPVDVYWTPIFA